MELDYYKVLGLRESAAQEEIRRAYRKLAKRYHPDSNPGDRKAEKRFREAAEAYAVLGNEKKRREYDRNRSNSKAGESSGPAAGPGGERRPGDAGPGGGPGGQKPGTGINFSDMAGSFEQFFGFRPDSGTVDGGQLNPGQQNQNKKTRTNPIDMTELFQRYMGKK